MGYGELLSTCLNEGSTVLFTKEHVKEIINQMFRYILTLSSCVCSSLAFYIYMQGWAKLPDHQNIS